MKREAHRVRHDLLLCGGCLALALLMLVLLRVCRDEGGYAVVRIDGETHCRLSLTENTEYVIETADGQRNTLVIEDGRAYVSEATCPDGICTAHRPITRDGESIVCLPHRVVIELEGGTEMAT